MNFEELGVSREILEALKKMEFESPTPIQEQAIPLLMQGEDLIGQARTGTGKTAAFGIPILEKLVSGKGSKTGGSRTGTQDSGLETARLGKPYALILAPTRELALQVTNEMRKMGELLNPKIVCVYGGQEIEKQFHALRAGADIITGTPGRILDHISRGTLSLSGVSMVVLDEADRMLDMGFIEDVDRILAECKKERQTMLFSATMPDEIKGLCEKYMVSPQTLKVSSDEVDTKNIEQFYMEVSRQTRLPALFGILAVEKPSLAIVFARTKMGSDRLARILNDRGFNAMCLHGDMSQNKRDRVMRTFREGKLHILVATDLAARGIDVDDISHVINYDIPEEPNTYVHRIGRTGRMEKKGRAFSLIFPDQSGLMLSCAAASLNEAKRIEMEIPQMPPRVRRDNYDEFPGEERGYGNYGRRGDGPSSRFGGHGRGGNYGGERGGYGHGRGSGSYRGGSHGSGSHGGRSEGYGRGGGSYREGGHGRGGGGHGREGESGGSESRGSHGHDDYKRRADGTRKPYSGPREKSGWERGKERKKREFGMKGGGSFFGR